MTPASTNPTTEWEGLEVSGPESGQDPAVPEPEADSVGNRGDAGGDVAEESDTLVTPAEETGRYPTRNRQVPNYYRPGNV